MHKLLNHNKDSVTMDLKTSQKGIFWTIVLATLAMLIFGGCTEQQAIKTPAIIVGIGNPGNDCRNSASVVIRDADGVVYSYPCNSEMAKAISVSRAVGDTIQ